MKESYVLRFDARDMEVVDILRSLGVPRKVSNMLAYLANVDEATSRDIERGSDLRQPEVSLALRILRKNNWIDERVAINDGTGRPMKIYRLSTSIEDVLRFYEEETIRETNKAMERIQKLRNLLNDSKTEAGSA